MYSIGINACLIVKHLIYLNVPFYKSELTSWWYARSDMTYLHSVFVCL